MSEHIPLIGRRYRLLDNKTVIQVTGYRCDSGQETAVVWASTVDETTGEKTGSFQTSMKSISRYTPVEVSE